MGNCFEKDQPYHPHHQIIKKHLSEITPTTVDHFSDHHKTPSPPPSHFSGDRKKPSPPQLQPQPQPEPEITLCGDPTSPYTHYLRFSLLYKPNLSLHFFPSQMPLSLFTLRFADDPPVSGPPETLLRFIDSKLPHPQLFFEERELERESVVIGVVRMAALQHKSMTWHLERVVRWGLDLATRGGKVAVDPSVGTPKMEVGKFGKSYGKLLEILLEHAQMEERVIFPILHAADRGVCRCVNEEHARDLPIMNGIKEDIKSIGVIETGTSNHREALHSLSARLEMLQENCREHFDEEERNLFTLMEAAELSMEQQRKVVEQCIDVMQGTHSHLFRFFIEGLLPHEAMEYLELVMKYIDKEKATSVLRILVE